MSAPVPSAGPTDPAFRGQRDVRLVLPRGDGRTCLEILGLGPSARVQLARYQTDGTRAAAVAVQPAELDRVIEAFRECRRVLLGAPDPHAEARAAQEAAGIVRAPSQRRRPAR